MSSPDYHISLLLKEMEKRKKNNPRYSLRAFARFLGIGSSTLSRLLMSQQEFSIPISHKIIAKLNLSKEDKTRFTASITNAKKRLAEDLFVNAFSSDEADLELTHQDHDHNFMPKWLLNSSSNIVTVVDKDHRIIKMNKCGAHLYGLTPADFTGKTLSDWGIPQEVQDHYQQAFTTKLEHKAEVCYTCKKRKYWFETFFTPFLNKHGEVTSVASLSFDITEKKMIEWRLKYMNMMSGILLDKKDPFSAFQILVSYSATEGNYTDGAVFYYIDEKQDQIMCWDHKDLVKKYKLEMLLKENGEGLNSLLSIPQKKAVLFKELAELERFLPNVIKRSFFDDLKLGSIIYVPLLDGCDVVGALFFFSSEESVYDEADREFTSQIGLRASHMLSYQKYLRDA